jgi:hypothetical protein
MNPFSQTGSQTRTLCVSTVLLLAFYAVDLSAQSPCVPPPAGLVGWWRGEGDAKDSIGTNHGTLVNGVGFVAGEVGQAFNFTAISSGVALANSTNLQLQDFTLEVWIKRGSVTRSSWDIYGIAHVLGAAWGGYGMGLNDKGNIFLSKIGYSNVFSTNSVSDTNGFHHVVVTKSGSTVMFYIDGAAETSPPYDPGFVFNGTFAIGARGSDYAATFLGAVDEASIYNRALTSAEVAAIYEAGKVGKCLTAPTIFTQPGNQNVLVGGDASFTVAAGGSDPLSYQWQKNGEILTGATASTLVLSDIQISDGGSYSVVVSNAEGVATSADGILTVTPPPPCQPPPLGLVGWWNGDSNANDSVGGNNGTLQNGASFAVGEVHQAFSFNGVNQFVQIPDAPALDPVNSLTVEAWVYLTGNPSIDVATIVTKQGTVIASDIQYQLESYIVSGRLTFRCTVYLPTGYAWVNGNTNVQLNTWYHVAMTYDNSTLKLYVDGALDGSVPATGPIAPTTEPLRIGGAGSGPWFFDGRVDEVSLYDRALSAVEIQAIYNAGAGGKCTGTIAPSFITQPESQSAVIGSSANFTAAAAGSIPLSYQWLFNGVSIPGATTNTLTLNSVSNANAGTYSIVVTNVAGSATSTNAALTVVLPPALIQVAGATAADDGTVSVPVNLVANGNENAVGFTLGFDTNLLTYEGVVLGSGASGGNLLLNPNQAGRVGVALGLAANATFGAGTQQLVLVNFTSAMVTTSTSTPISFSDTPIKRVLSDSLGSPLLATFAPGIVLLPPTEFEGDVFPRPNGDEALTVSDWVLVGRYVARLDSPTNALEFQKADCAPRETLGDGLLTVSDWVQAGRYAAGLDPLTRVGGPTSAVPAVVTTPALGPVARKTQSNPRQLRAVAPTLFQGQTGTVEVALQAQGNENALAFSLAFDPAILVFTGATAGDAASGAALNVNANLAAQGRLGFVLALSASQSFAAGSKQLIKANFRAATTASANARVTFADQPVPRGVSDPSAATLATDYIDALIALNGLPSLRIAPSANGVNLSWPTLATGFVLQESSNAQVTGTGWTAVTSTPVVTNNENTVVVTPGATNRFYRLYHP